MTTEQLYDTYLLGNYARASITIVRGKGCRVWDDAGREYLDFASGIAVSAIGHCHPYWVERVREQAGTLLHSSNVYRNVCQGQLAQKLVKLAGPGRIMFCNSGTEANEALIKLARLHGASLAGREGVRYKVICAEKAFHGRTFGSMSATPQEKIQSGFRPMLDGFAFGRLNDIDSFASLVDDTTAAIFLETIQGEGGIHPCTTEFLRDIRALCDANNLLLMLDEVQCGSGRTGRFFAFEHSGVQPDAIGMAKGLGGGFPIGAVWISERYSDLFKPGSHGSTFAGGPLAATAALATIEILERDALLLCVRERSVPWIAELRKLAAAFPDQIHEVRGTGYLVALAMTGDPAPFIDTIREHGMLVMRAGDNAVRLLPPLNVSEEDLRSSIDILRSALTSQSKSSTLI